ncbi:MAG: molybdopterin/thiamine biosynthesis adenylyltransferase/rhodanese-related sulfurtransferase [Sphingobacteriales bacterium]|jgi:molybdopterin/thiamine biosynthesis adenylyltransferase/rhodanese-related sulfurtransferase
MILSEEEKKQYNRHLILDEIGELGQLNLKEAKVAIIGAGGLGCPVLQYLCAAGVGQLTVVDGDTIDSSNLQRQVLYGKGDIGQNKAKVAVRALKTKNAFVTFIAISQNVNQENIISIIKDSTIVVDCSDNFNTRYLINDACVLTHKTLVFGSILKFEGQLGVCNVKESNGLYSPNYRDLYPETPLAADSPSCSEVGVLGVLPSLIGTMQASEVIKIIVGLDGVLIGKVLSYNLLNHQTYTLSYERDPENQLNEPDFDLYTFPYASFCGAEVTQLNIDDFYKKISTKNTVLIDVRTSDERKKESIGGLHIPFEFVESRIGEFKRETTYLFYCKSGFRSANAAQLLINQNFLTDQVFSLKGGLEAIEKSNSN